ncbi:MAG: ATP-binding protein [Candidatus Omnitrophica bacterium]|nr:ATP-binding protein [Candidatus Omnitrophota bacterium]
MLQFYRMENLIKRHYWLNLIEKSWIHRPIIWLSGVRRTGKTSLTHTLENIEYFDCELPRTRQSMEDPEGFLVSLKGKRIILDEIHRLGNPSELLKIAADHYPDIKILATGSSSLGASRKFRDTLTGRKVTVLFTPMIASDLDDFKSSNLEHRLLRGGLPPFFMDKKIPEKDFQEWMDDYWAKDIQELFRLERKFSFQKCIELIMMRSGGIFEATKFSKECEVSRTTIMNYLRILDETFVAHVIKPFSTHKATEIVAAPKVYAFDTGFICYYRGWDKLRSDDMGILWEHFVLNEMQGRLQTRNIRYWRDKRHHEIDFVIAQRNQKPIAIECKWKAGSFNPANIKAFRHLYPKGDNYVVASDVTHPHTRRYNSLDVTFITLATLIKKLLPSDN